MILTSKNEREHFFFCSFILLSLLLFVYVVGGIEYQHSQQLSQEYQINWTVSGEDLYLALSVKTSGWIGFGIGEPSGGSMGGSDIVVIQWDDNNILSVSDRYATGITEPSVDDCQDWILREYSYNPEGQAFAELQRKLNTRDEQDRIIAPGNSKVVWAYGDASDKKLVYHGTELRGASSVIFIPPETPTPTINATYTAEIRMPNVTIPGQLTSSFCHTVAVPLPDPTKEYHIIKVDSFVQPRNQDIVHSLIVHTCKLGFPADQWFNNTSQCNSPLGYGACYGILYAWGVGGTSLILPDEAGYRIGQIDDNDIQYLVLEIHYSNEFQTEGRIDTSGIIIHYTEKLRKWDAGTIALGNIGADEQRIPPNTDYYRVEASCPSYCTAMWPHEIHVFADFLHMHEAGSMIWSTQHRDNNRIPGYFNRIEYWNYLYQDFIPVNKTIKPGDRMNLVCIYDTIGRGNNYIQFGFSAEKEICFEFLAYYPRLIIQGRHALECGSAHFREKLQDGQYIPAMSPDTRKNYCTLCWGQKPVDTENFTRVNPDIPDPIGVDEERVFGSANVSTICQILPEQKQPSQIYIWIIVGLAVIVLFSLVIFAVVRKKDHIVNAYRSVSTTPY